MNTESPQDKNDLEQKGGDSMGEGENLEKLLKQVAPDVLDSIPVQKKKQLAQVEVSILRSGPLPPPDELERYAQIIPNGGDRIMKQVEAQTAHRIEIEKMVISRQQKQTEIGQLFAFIIAITAIVAGAWLGAVGQPWLGGVIAGTTVVSLVATFLSGKSVMKKNLQEKDANLRGKKNDNP